MGLDPLQPDLSRRPTPAIQSAGGIPYLTLTFRRLLLANEVDYGVEVSSNLVDWRPAAQLVTGPALNVDGTVTFAYRDSVAAFAETTRFMRLKVTKR